MSEQLTIKWPGTDTPITATKVEGSSVNKSKQEEAMSEAVDNAFWERISDAAKSFNKFHSSYARDFGLTELELVSATFLENLNLREFFPKEVGSSEAYDEITSKVYSWFQEQLKNMK